MMQMLIAEPLIEHASKKWWRSFKDATIWHIWIDKNQEVIGKKRTNLIVIKTNIWQQIKKDMQNKWSKRLNQVRVGVITKLDA